MLLKICLTKSKDFTNTMSNKDTINVSDKTTKNIVIIVALTTLRKFVITTYKTTYMTKGCSDLQVL